MQTLSLRLSVRSRRGAKRRSYENERCCSPGLLYAHTTRQCSMAYRGDDAGVSADYRKPLTGVPLEAYESARHEAHLTGLLSAGGAASLDCTDKRWRTSRGLSLTWSRVSFRRFSQGAPGARLR